MNPSPVSAVIPTWNGVHLLLRHLPSLLEELIRHHSDSECIVIDDGSTDKTAEMITREYPKVRIIRMEKNRGFSSAVNAGINAALHEHLLVLNNDVAVRRGFLTALQREFDRNAQTFAAASVQNFGGNCNNSPVEGFNTMRWQGGHMEFANRTAEVLAGLQTGLAFCTGGCSMFSRQKLLLLGGFCEIFDPFYYEDTELSLQALRRGWSLAFAPESRVGHEHATTSRRKPWKLRFIPVRNYLILHWVVLDTVHLWRRHLLAVAFRTIVWPLQGRIRYVVGLALALGKLPAIMRERRKRSLGATRSIEEVIKTHGFDG